jgi:Ni,Fe-hydrogenase III large subunit
LRHLAQSPDLPPEEKERIRRVLAEMQEDMEKAWTAMELKSVISARDSSMGGMPVFFLDILLRPGNW